MDKISKEKRSQVMAAIHSKNTKPELVVRHYLWHHGYRYRLNVSRLPGHPDIVLRKYRTCIFVNGCFWHGHDCQHGRMPKANAAYWRNKITRNRERDKQEQQRLAAMGWHCIVVWECQLKNKAVREQTLRSLDYTLNHIFLADHIAMYPDFDNDVAALAAEPSS